MTALRDKRIVLISHDLYRAGSQLLLLETAVRLREAGAHIDLVTLADDARADNLAAHHGFEVLPAPQSFDRAASADLVIANTAVAAGWVDAYLEKHAMGARSLIWWIHEIEAASYVDRMKSLRGTAMALFDSHASLSSWVDALCPLPPSTRVIHPCVADAFVEQAAQSRFPYRTAGVLRRLPLKPGMHTRDQIRKALGIAPGDFAVALIGTLLPKKGQEFFMHTVERLLGRYPDLPLKVIMVGFHDDAHKAGFLKRLGEQGRKALDARRAITVVRNLAPYYAASDAFVMNSQGLGENFGRVTLEGMTFGLPVLGTDAGGTREIVENGVTGLLHPVGAHGQEQLAENILTLMDNRNMGKGMGDAGSRRVDEKFKATRFDAELGAALRSVIDSNSSGSSSELSPP